MKKDEKYHPNFRNEAILKMIPFAKENEGTHIFSLKKMERNFQIIIENTPGAGVHKAPDGTLFSVIEF